MRVTKISGRQTLVAGLFLLTSMSVLRAQGLDPRRPPGGNFNLTNFYLGLPVDSSGGTTGVSASISAAQLTAGYSNALYFYTGPLDGAMVFWAPVTGATTPNSSYPRSELREQLTPPSNSTNWLPYGNHLLSAQCRVTQVPSTGKVIIGQIHCYTGNARPLLKLQYNNGVIEALVKTNSNFDPDYKFYFQNVGLSNLVSYQVHQENGWLTTTVNGSNQTINIFATDPGWATNGLYFKAGSYCQDNTGPTNEGARVAFYTLSRSHAPSITNQPVSRSVVVGTNATFSVSAAGNGPLRYQWQFNDANNLAGATNASLTLTNIQTTNAGGYSVKVTDSLGAVTSAVAALTVLDPPAIIRQPANVTVTVGSNAAFSVAATGSAPLTYQWYFNTNVPLSGTTNATLLVTNVSISNAGFYSVIITNAAGSLTSAFAALIVNRPPLGGTYAMVTGQAVPLSTPISNLLAVASDPDGDTLTVSGVTPLSTNGGSVLLAGSSVWYAPLSGLVGLDQWSYTLTDACGASATGTVSVTVISSNAITLNPIEQGMRGDGLFYASFQGVPGLRYVVDCATNVMGPWDSEYTNLTAGPEGVFEFQDLNAPPQPQRFYRVRYP